MNEIDIVFMHEFNQFNVEMGCNRSLFNFIYDATIV